MITIYKFPVPSQRSFTLELPDAFKVLSLQVQHGTPCVWVMLDNQAPRRAQRFEMRATGHGCSGLEEAAHVGTFLTGGFVFHVFHVEMTWIEPEVFGT